MSDHEIEVSESTPKPKAKAKKTVPKHEGSGLDKEMASNTQVTDAVSHSNAKVERFLPEMIRDEMIARLIEWGFEQAPTYSDQALMDAQNRYITETREKLVAQKVEEIGDKLRVYAHGTELTDMAFIDRLYHMSVHKKYLRLFQDRDKDLSDKKIWEIIRFSPIPAVEGGVKEIFKERYKPILTNGIDPLEHQFRYGNRR